MNLLRQTYKDKTVLITGNTGFKGSWLSIWLHSLGAKIVGLSSNIPTVPSNYNASQLASFSDEYFIDIRDAKAVKNVIEITQPDFIFHMAAQALVKHSYDDPLETFAVNAFGTANILDALKTMNKRVIAVMITSDKAYDNVEWAWGYRETDTLGGKDPYSASKSMAEIVIKSYVQSFFHSSDSNIRVGITRAGNVIGGGDWAKDRVIPDSVIAWSKNGSVDIRNPDATRPWQHVLEPLSGYLLLGSNLSLSEINHGQAYNFGPSSNHNYSVGQLITEISKSWDRAKWRDTSDSEDHVHEAGLLKLNCDKALFDLDWRPVLDFYETVKMTADWYKNYYGNNDSSMYDFSLAQIRKYAKLAQRRQITWAKND
jgi:CDP-glucose 4,6-dehydratase